MRSDLLLRLADLLEADAAKADGIKFDLALWGKTEGFYPYGADVPLDCGTTACAMGLAAMSGIFADEGLSVAATDVYTPKLTEPDGSVWWGFEAIKELFQIRSDTAYKIFGAESYPQDLRRGANAELAVAGRIRAVVAGGADILNDI